MYHQSWVVTHRGLLLSRSGRAGAARRRGRRRGRRTRRRDPCRRRRAPRHRCRRSRSNGCAEPRSSTALASTSAIQASAATTVASVRSVSDGRPVAGSIRWWRASPSTSQWRRSVVEVATAPSSRPRCAIGSRDHGCSTATVHAVARPAARRHAEVAAEVDADAARRRRPADLGDDEVGGEALADAAGVEARAGRQADRRRRRPRCRAQPTVRTLRPAGGVGPSSSKERS